jgi:hypothetical protein
MMHAAHCVHVHSVGLRTLYSAGLEVMIRTQIRAYSLVGEEVARDGLELHAYVHELLIERLAA